MPSEAVSARPLCEYLLHLAIRPFLLTLMLTYTPPDARPPAKTHEKPWLLLLMAFAWLWPGVFSHDLWNPAEPAV
ncbi:glycosyltransferase family 39 protein, partial [Neisseria gonorrhoeae]